MPAAYMREVYAFAEKAHALPKAVKQRAAKVGVYTGPDVGVVEPAYDGASTATACAWEYSKHGFTLAPGAALEYPEELDYLLFMKDLYRRQDALGEVLALALADYLGLPRRHFADLARDDFGTIRCMRYAPPSAAAETTKASSLQNDDTASSSAVGGTNSPSSVDAGAADVVGIAPHTDFEMCTIMHQNAPGLQLLRPSDATQSWIDAPVADDAFIVIIGDVLERVTNGRLRATPHRVVLEDHARSSIIRFYALKPEALIEPHPHFVTIDRPPQYSPVTMRKHMATTMSNVKNGTPSWDPATQTSLSARYVYDTPDF